MEAAEFDCDQARFPEIIANSRRRRRSEPKPDISHHRPNLVAGRGVQGRNQLAKRTPIWEPNRRTEQIRYFWRPSSGHLGRSPKTNLRARLEKDVAHQIFRVDAQAVAHEVEVRAVLEEAPAAQHVLVHVVPRQAAARAGANRFADVLPPLALQGPHDLAENLRAVAALGLAHRRSNFDLLRQPAPIETTQNSSKPKKIKKTSIISWSQRPNGALDGSLETRLVSFVQAFRLPNTAALMGALGWARTGVPKLMHIILANIRTFCSNALSTEKGPETCTCPGQMHRTKNDEALPGEVCVCKSQSYGDWAVWPDPKAMLRHIDAEQKDSMQDAHVRTSWADV